MIRLFSISINQFVYSYIHPHKRKSVRLTFLQAMVYILKLLMAEFVLWRNKAVTRANVTCETISIEWYLNYLYDPTLKRIYIENAEESGLPFGIEAIEPAAYQETGIEDSEPSAFIYTPLPGEDLETGTASFGVFVPNDLANNSDAITAIVRVYSFGGKTFKIVLF